MKICFSHYDTEVSAGMEGDPTQATVPCASVLKPHPVLQKKGEHWVETNTSLWKRSGWGRIVLIRLLISEIFRLINSNDVVSQL